MHGFIAININGIFLSIIIGYYTYINWHQPIMQLEMKILWLFWIIYMIYMILFLILYISSLLEVDVTNGMAVLIYAISFLLLAFAYNKKYPSDASLVVLIVFFVIFILSFIFYGVSKLSIHKQRKLANGINTGIETIFGIVGFLILLGLGGGWIFILIIGGSSGGNNYDNNEEYYDYQSEYEYNNPGYHYVDDYYRKDGTHVDGHWKTNPDEYESNNLNP